MKSQQPGLRPTITVNRFVLIFIGKVSVALHHLELFPVGEKATFQIHIDSPDNAELAVSVTGPKTDLPVQVTGNVKNGFLAEFLPQEVRTL